MGDNVLSTRTAQHWFNRFKNGNLELDDLPRSGRPVEVDVNLLKQLIEQDPRLTLRCLAEELVCSYVTVEKTSERISEDMERWSLDTSRVITTSTTTPG